MISAFLSSNDFWISAFAASLETSTGKIGVIFDVCVAPIVATSSTVFAASTAKFALSKASSTFAFASAFSSLVALFLVSIATFCSFATLSKSNLAFSLANKIGKLLIVSWSALSSIGVASVSDRTFFASRSAFCKLFQDSVE